MIPSNEQQQLMNRVYSYPEPFELMSIQLWIDKFYEINEKFTGQRDQFNHLRNIRNNIKNKMDSYLKTFRNQPIMDDFYTQLIQARNDATIQGKLNRYKQYMNEIRVIQEFKGIQDNITEKLADQLYDQWTTWEEENNPEPPNMEEEYYAADDTE